LKVIRIRTQLQGIPVGPGIVVGKVYLVDRRKVKPREFVIDPEMVDGEISRFREGLEETQRQLEELKQHYGDEKLGDYSYLIDVHLLMLKDKMLAGQTESIIKNNLRSADWSLWSALQNIKASFTSMGDEYFRDRITDIDHLGERILRNLIGHKYEKLSDVKGDAVIVAHDLSPMDTAQMDVQKIQGFVTDLGGRTSHTAILARSLSIPAVVGLETVTQYADNGDTIVVDGLDGVVIINPTPKELAKYRARKARYGAYRTELESFAALPAITRDGHKVRVAANIELVGEIDKLRRYGAEGIGLYRTEFLYMNRDHPPTEDEHFETYCKVAEAVHPFPVTIRTLDLGGDKIVHSVPTTDEMNPSLGLRSIRLCLREKDIFKTQLRGILRASVVGNVRIMFPMISGLGEVLEVLEILRETKEELRSQGIEFDPHMPVGVMIEVPSAALTADILAPKVDFFSVGTNDLIQYSLAIDRVNEHVAYLYEPLHPGVLRLMKMVVEAGHKHGIRVGVCGEMAGDELYTLVLLGLGVDDLSMHSLSVPRIKRVINHASMAEAGDLVNDVMELGTASEIHSAVEEYMKARYPGILEPMEHSWVEAEGRELN